MSKKDKKKAKVEEKAIMPLCVFPLFGALHLMKYNTQADSPDPKHIPMMLLESVCGERLVVLITLERFGHLAKIILPSMKVFFQTGGNQNYLTFDGENFVTTENLPVQIRDFSVAQEPEIGDTNKVDETSEEARTGKKTK